MAALETSDLGFEHHHTSLGLAECCLCTTGGVDRAEEIEAQLAIVLF